MLDKVVRQTVAGKLLEDVKFDVENILLDVQRLLESRNNSMLLSTFILVNPVIDTQIGDVVLHICISRDPLNIVQALTYPPKIFFRTHSQSIFPPS